MTHETPQGEEQTVGSLAACIARLDLVDVSLLALDGLRPLSALAAPLLWTAQPALGLFVEPQQVDALAQALERPDGVDRLRRMLEAAREAREARKARKARTR